VRNKGSLVGKWYINEKNHQKIRTIAKKNLTFNKYQQLFQNSQIFSEDILIKRVK
jgi:hypothetical protein